MILMMPPSTRYQYYLWRSDISVVFVYRECSWQNSYSLTYSNHQQVFAPRFGDVPRRWTNTCPMFLQGINLWTSTCPVFWKGHSSVDECLPHVLERVFVHGTNACPMCWRGYSSMGRILASRTNTKPTNTNTYSYSYSCRVCKVCSIHASYMCSVQGA